MAFFMEFDAKYWNGKYIHNKTKWDIGYVSTPLKEYFDQLKNKKTKILIPGAGNAYEAEYLINNGFENTFVLDISEKAIESFRQRMPTFPAHQIFKENFFEHQNTYDLIVEQTFFCSIDRDSRNAYVEKMVQLLKPKGKLVGLLFNHEFGQNDQPFGGTPQEYKNIFSPHFRFQHFDVAYNSIKPRQGREHFLCFQKK
jgi:methyl halide transferase